MAVSDCLRSGLFYTIGDIQYGSVNLISDEFPRLSGRGAISEITINYVDSTIVGSDCHLLPKSRKDQQMGIALPRCSVDTPGLAKLSHLLYILC